MVKRLKNRKKSKPESRAIPKNKLRIGLKDLLGLKVSTRTIILAFALILFVAISISFYMRSSETSLFPPTTTIPTTTIPTTTTLPPTPKGTLIIALKDEDQKIPGGALLKNMSFTVSGVEIYSDDTEEWMSVLAEEKTLDLLKYTTTYAQIVEEEIEADAYDKIKLSLDPGEVTLVHTIVGVYRPKTYDLIVQEETTIDHEFNITEGQTLTLVLDFDIPNSVMRTGVGYLLTPVITVTEEIGQAENLIEV